MVWRAARPREGRAGGGVRVGGSGERLSPEEATGQTERGRARGEGKCVGGVRFQNRRPKRPPSPLPPPPHPPPLPFSRAGAPPLAEPPGRARAGSGGDGAPNSTSRGASPPVSGPSSAVSVCPHRGPGGSPAPAKPRGRGAPSGSAPPAVAPPAPSKPSPCSPMAGSPPSPALPASPNFFRK